MIRFLFRLAAAVMLAIAVIMAVLDATRTVAASALVMTPLDSSWIAVSPQTFEAFRSIVADRLHPLVWDPVATTLLDLPGFAFFAGAALLLYLVGYRPRRVGRLVTI